MKKLRKSFRRLTINGTHWQWKVGKHCIVAYCDETREKKFTTNMEPLYTIGTEEYPWEDEVYRYVSPKSVREWILGKS